MAGLGAAESAHMIDLLRNLSVLATILLIEHDMDVACGSHLRPGQWAAHRNRYERDFVRSNKAVRVAYPGEGDFHAMLQVEGLQASYGRGRVLSDISLSVGDGEVVTLLGRNGMGKTTTIRSIIGLIPPLAGAISFAGVAIAGRTPEAIVAALAWCRRVGRFFHCSPSRKISSPPPPIGSVARTRGPCRGSTRSSPGCRNAGGKWAAPCRAANSKCWRSGARS